MSEAESWDWAAEEFSTAELGDQRLTYRLVQLARVLGERPQASLPDASREPATLTENKTATPG